jgi:glycosyltransferase involved in cell wall biosynthesis
MIATPFNKIMDDVWVIIPACNEEKRLPDVLQRLQSITRNYIVVDDGSTDKTKEIAEKNGAIVLKHIINMGKGAALKTGCDYAYSRGAKIILVMDADGQHKPEDIPRMVNTLVQNKLDIVFGGRKPNKNMPGVFKLGNSGLSWLTNILYNVKIKDTQSGFRGFTSKSYKKIRWTSNDYAMESEMIANVGKKHLKYKEIPIQTIYLDKYKGTTIFNGLKIGFETLFWRFSK